MKDMLVGLVKFGGFICVVAALVVAAIYAVVSFIATSGREKVQ